MPRRVALIVNEDFDHFLSSRSADEMTVEGLHAVVDLHAHTQVTHLFFCPGGMRMNYRSAVREAIWDGVDESKLAGGQARWVANARLLHERGLDLYAHWIDRARLKNISPWLSVRMNDVHYTEDENHFAHSSFWKTHREYWRIPGSGRAYADRALDYAIPQVREYQLALIRELLERYQPDGIELDWLRFVYHLKPGHEREGTPILTDFVRQVRELTMARRIGLAARVPALPGAALDVGLDALTWVKDRLVDILTVSPFFTTCDLDIPVEEWSKLLGAARQDVTLAAGLDMRLMAHRAGPMRWLDPETARGFAAAMLARGADAAYLFNYQYLHDDRYQRTPETSRRAFEANLKVLADPAALATLSRRHVLTFHDIPHDSPSSLPTQLTPHRPVTLRLDTGPSPREDQTATLRLELSPAATSVLEVRLRGQPCVAVTDAPGVAAFVIPPGALRLGHNDFEARMISGPPTRIEWAQVDIADLAVTRRAAVLRRHPDAPAGREWIYGLGLPVQLSATRFGVFANIRLNGAKTIDLEIGNDMVVFDSVENPVVRGVFALGRGGEEVQQGKRRVLAKYPVAGGFVPIGAKLQGQPHPHAGTGYGLVSVMGIPVDNTIAHASTSADLTRYFELEQYAYDGEVFRVTATRRVAFDELLPGWVMSNRALACAIADGADLLGGIVGGRAGQPSGAGLARWRRVEGVWGVVDYTPVTGQDGSFEPSVVRDKDGSLLFCARGSGSEQIKMRHPGAERNVAREEAVMVWRSADNGKSWEQVIRADRVRAGTPVTIGRSAGGMIFILGNPRREKTTAGVAQRSILMRESALLWPLTTDRHGLSQPIVVRDVAAEFGSASPDGSPWRVDHPTCTPVRQADGRWSCALVYRVMTQDECIGNAPAPERSGLHMEEIRHAGAIRPTWEF